MKIIVICIVVCSLCAVPAVSMGQSGTIGLYADAAGTICFVDDSAAGYFMVYVVIAHLPEMASALFQIVPSADFTPLYIAEVSPLPRVAIYGDSQTGIDITFGECLTSPQQVLTVTYQRFGTSPPCSYLRIGPNPRWEYTRPIVNGCPPDFPLFEPTPLRLYMNPDGSCPCNLPVPVKPSNWGRIKALYR